MKPGRLSRRDLARRLLSAAPLLPALDVREVLLKNETLEVVLPVEGGRLASRRLKSRLTSETVVLPAPEFTLEFDGGYRVGSSDMKVEVIRAGASEAELLFTGERVQVSVRRLLPPGKAYVRKETRVRRTGASPLRLVRAELEDWRGVRRDWKSMTADRMKYGSHPIFCETWWAGVEFVAAFNEYGPDGFLLCSRPGGREIGTGWFELRPTVTGACTKGGARDAFLTYLEDVRLAPARLSACYNSWWTLPKVVVQKDNLALIRELKAALYDRHGAFFDVITTDMGWSNPRSIWELDRSILPAGFDDIGAIIVPAGGRLGIWMSPSEQYPPVCDYDWAERNGYVVLRPKPGLTGRPAISLGDPRYREQTKRALRKLIRENRLAHIKYDGFTAFEDQPHHGLRPGVDSVEPLAEYCLELLQASKQENPDLVTEPTCMNSWANYISPWILKYSDTIWGNAGGDCPLGIGPAPDYRESHTNARDAYIFSSLNEVWAPQNALHYFDIVHVDGKEGFPNHAAMAFGRGRFFISTYLNPKVMDREDWRICAGLLKWARANTEILRNTRVLPSNIGEGEPYVYAHWLGRRGILAVRNPSNESRFFPVDLSRTGAPAGLTGGIACTQYPCRRGIASGLTGRSTLQLRLAPWELTFVEIVPKAALKEAVVMGGRWTRARDGTASVVPDPGVTRVRLLEPGGRSRAFSVPPRRFAMPGGEMISESLRPVAESEWLTGRERRYPVFPFHYPAEFGSEEIRRLDRSTARERKFRTVAFDLECSVSIPEGADRGQVLFLVQFPGREYCPSECAATAGGSPARLEQRPSSERIGYFVASKDNYWKDLLAYECQWCWYILEAPPGRHRVRFRGRAGHAGPRFGIWTWVERDLAGKGIPSPLRCGEPAMPQYRAEVEREGALIRACREVVSS